MKKTFGALAVIAAVAVSAPAYAFHCPKDMAAIDAALAKGPMLSEDQTAEVTRLRAEGERQHKAGSHQASVDALAQATKILGIR